MKKSRWVGVVVFMFMILFSSFAFSQIEKQKALADGLYQGEYEDVVVSVIIKDDKILKIEILSSVDQKEYTMRMQVMLDRIIEKQTVDVDGVSGATISSEKLKKAIKNALKDIEKER